MQREFILMMTCLTLITHGSQFFIYCWYSCIVNSYFYHFISDLINLKTAADRRRYLALCPGTHANHNTHLLHYLRFCTFFSLLDFPAAPNTLCLFAEFLIRSYTSHTSVLNALSSVKFYHLLGYFDITSFSNFKFLLTRRAITRSFNFLPNTTSGLDLSKLKLLCNLARSLGAQGKVFATLCITLFFSMARLSSFLPISLSKFDHTKIVTLGDISVANYGFDLKLNWSKTDQDFGRGIVIPLLKSSDPAICPVLALSELINHLPSKFKQYTPLFSWVLVQDGPLLSFTMPMARRWLNHLCRLLRWKSHITFHDFRRGSCKLAYDKGADLYAIKALGNWKSDCVDIYLPSQSARLRAATKLAS